MKRMVFLLLAVLLATPAAADCPYPESCGGGSPAFVDLPGPPLEASMSDWGVYFNDFVLLDLDISTTNDWTVTNIGTGGTWTIPSVIQTGSFGLSRIAPTGANDGLIVQLDGSLATPAAGVFPTGSVDIVYVTRILVADVSETGFFVGLAALTGTPAVMTGPSSGVTSDTHIGFYITDAALDLFFTVAGNDDTQADVVDTGYNLADNTWYDLAFRTTSATAMEAYVRAPTDGLVWKRVATLTSLTTPLSAVITPTIAEAGGAAGDNLDTDFILYMVSRRR